MPITSLDQLSDEELKTKIADSKIALSNLVNKDKFDSRTKLFLKKCKNEIKQALDKGISFRTIAKTLGTTDSGKLLVPVKTLKEFCEQEKLAPEKKTDPTQKQQ